MMNTMSLRIPANLTSLLTLSDPHLRLTQSCDDLLRRLAFPCHVLVSEMDAENSRIRLWFGSGRQASLSAEVQGNRPGFFATEPANSGSYDLLLRLSMRNHASKRARRSVESGKCAPMKPH